MYDDPEYCSNCANKMKKEAESRIEKLREGLVNDPEFKSLKSESERKVYVGKNYKEEKVKNRFVYLPALAKEAYAELKMRNRQMKS